MGIEFSKRAVIRVIMDAMAGLDSLKDIYDKVEAMEEPTQPELVEVPPCADVFLNNGNKELNLAYLISCKRNFLSCEMREGELKQWLRNTSLHDLLSLANGYTVKKEQLYYVKVGIMAFMDWDDSFVAKMCTTDSTGWENMAAQLSLDKAEGVAVAIGGEAVPVEEKE
ncbi:DUF1642 domain-containing protein [Enterococcus sp. 5H]|uniref:DUF1642 domain-containing protein n=1 Tax=Enterococcus sp. 5H TaxID=1229490 RepID=UPI002304C6B9|nr:DUF1642 domain-containing protein [Enterococcus sp. 5H]MDA9472071.1 hypothetical protein [Enterococcus sp. 5H]